MTTLQDWFSYRLTDFIMFSQASYDRMVTSYNQVFWPWQVAVIAAALFAWWISIRHANIRTLLILVAASWLLTAYGFFWQRYSLIFLVAPWFAGLFLLQTMLIVLLLNSPDTSILDTKKYASRYYLAYLLMFFALFIQPFVSNEFVGFMPDSTVMFTLGVIFILQKQRWWLYVIPSFWVLISGATKLGLFLSSL